MGLLNEKNTRQWFESSVRCSGRQWLAASESEIEIRRDSYCCCHGMWENKRLYVLVFFFFFPRPRVVYVWLPTRGWYDVRGQGGLLKSAGITYIPEVISPCAEMRKLFHDPQRCGNYFMIRSLAAPSLQIRPCVPTRSHFFFVPSAFKKKSPKKFSWQKMASQNNNSTPILLVVGSSPGLLSHSYNFYLWNFTLNIFIKINK